MGNTNEEIKEIRNSVNIVLLVLIALLMCSNVVTAVFYLQTRQKQASDNEIAQENQRQITKINQRKLMEKSEESSVAESSSLDENKQDENDDFDKDGLSDYDELYKYRTNPKIKDSDGDGFDDGEEIKNSSNPLVAKIDLAKDVIDSTEGEIIIKWETWPVVADYKKLFGHVSSDKAQSEFYNSMRVYEVGTVENGKYQSDKLYVIIYDGMGMSFSGNILRVIKNDNEVILLQNYIANPDSYDKYLDDTIRYWGKNFEKFKLNKQITIKNLSNGPEYIKIEGKDARFVRLDKKPLEMLLEVQNKRELFKYQDDKFLYKDDSTGCFIIAANDGGVVKYIVEMNFIGKKGDPGQYFGTVPSQLNIIWKDGEKNQDEYIFLRMTGCGGSTNCSDYADYISGVDDLVIVGKTNTGDNIYELKNVDFKKEKSEEAMLKTLYKNYFPGWVDGKQKEKISFKEFLATHPLVFWQDPFGNFVQFQKASYLPAVECGKPVIYLYPEVETDVSVKVTPTGGFKITEPEYKDGWIVRANPDGKLYNYNDEKSYPYLFWEGFGVAYQAGKKGFVVKRENLQKFLVEKLSKLGLVEHEYNEFIEFWLPRMQDKPYYFVTFMPQADFNEIAPLTVEPRPDTVIRVFMDYTGLDSKIKVTEQRIVTPERNGFVVVEWGGAMH